jgi:hypothetical protein
MPHRDPLLATLSKCVQMRAQLEELGISATEWREPATLDDAIAHAQSLERLLDDARVVLAPPTTKAEVTQHAYDSSLDHEDGSVSRREERRATIVKIAILAPVIAVVCAAAYVAHAPHAQNGFRAAITEQTPTPDFFRRAR